jgi:hypothetical protein
MISAFGKKKTVLAALILATLVISLTPIFTSKMQVNAQDETKISVLPATNTFYTNVTTPGDTFVVNITVSNVTSLWNYQVKLEWDASLLNYVNTTFPSDYVFAEAEALGKTVIIPNPSVQPGNVVFGAGLVQTDWAFNGTGTLGQVELEILTPPTSPPVSCDIALASTAPGGETYLWTPSMIDIPYTPEDSVFNYIDTLSVAIIPSSVYTSATQSVTFTANATGGALPYSYDWYLDNVLIPEAHDNVTCEIQFPESATTYKVNVTVTDDLGFQRTAQATANTLSMEVFIIVPPFTSQRTKIYADIGQTINFTTQVSNGVPPYSYDWLLNGAPIPEAKDNSTWAITFDTVADYTVSVNVTGSDGNYKKSSNVTVAVLPTPTTTVSIVPAEGLPTFYTNETVVGDTIVFNVTVNNVNDLQSWAVKVTWDPTLLNYSNIRLPDDHVFLGAGRAMILSAKVFGPGYVVWGCTYINSPYWTFNGSGVMCQVVLEVIRQPSPTEVSCDLSIAKEYYVTSNLLDGVSDAIPFDVETATYRYVLVPRVLHAVLGQTVETYSDAAIRANSVYQSDSETAINFTVYGAPGTTGFVNVTIPKSLLNVIGTPWKVYLGGTDVTSQATITETDEYAYVYLEFTFSSSATIKIEGNWIVPELANMFLIMFLLASSVALILAKALTKKEVPSN